jgi:hypothetical protein
MVYLPFSPVFAFSGFALAKTEAEKSRQMKSTVIDMTALFIKCLLGRFSALYIE